MDTEQAAARKRLAKDRTNVECHEATPPSHRPPVQAPPTVAELTSLRVTLDARHTDTLGRVDGLLREQKDLTNGIAEELNAIQKDGDELRAIEAADAGATSLIAQIRGRLTRRSRILERHSVGARLQEQCRSVHTTLRKAGAFADELHMCSVELAQEVDRLHADVEHSLRAAVEAEDRAEQLSTQLAELDARNDLTELRERDRIRFERADLETAVGLHNAKARLCAQEVEPARTLRDTVHSLHQEMAHYVLQASASVESSGRRIQALGLAADAPVVISELQDGLDQLNAAMSVTDAYLEQAHDMLTRVLPMLSQQMRSHGDQAALDLEQGLAAIEAGRSFKASDEALRIAALAEVDLIGTDIILRTEDLE